MMKPYGLLIACLLALNSARAMPLGDEVQGSQTTAALNSANKESLSVVPLEKIKEAVPVPPVAEEKSASSAIVEPVALPDHEQVRSALPAAAAEEPQATPAPVPEKKDEEKPVEPVVKAEEKLAAVPVKPEEKPETPKEEPPKKEEKELKVGEGEIHHHHHESEIKPTVGDVVAEHKSEKEAVQHHADHIAPVAAVAPAAEHHHEHVSPVESVAEHVHQHAAEPKSAVGVQEEQPILVEKKAAEPVLAAAAIAEQQEPIAVAKAAVPIVEKPAAAITEEKIDSRVVRGTEDVVAVASQQKELEHHHEAAPVEPVHEQQAVQHEQLQTAEAKSIVEPAPGAASPIAAESKPIAESPAQIVAEEAVAGVKAIVGAAEQQPKIEAALAEESKPQETPKLPEPEKPIVAETMSTQEAVPVTPTEVVAKEQARSDLTGEHHHQEHHQEHHHEHQEVKTAAVEPVKHAAETKSEQLPKPEQVMNEEQQPMVPAVPAAVIPKSEVASSEALMPQKDEEAKAPAVPMAAEAMKKKEAKKQEDDSSAEDSSSEESKEQEKNKDGEKKKLEHPAHEHAQQPQLSSAKSSPAAAASEESSEESKEQEVKKQPQPESSPETTPTTAKSS